VHVQHDGQGRLYVVQQQGIIRVHDGTALRVTPFLNIDPIVMGGGEEGLLSVAFHPNYAGNGYFYVYYTNTSGNNVVARYQRSTADPFVANPSSAFIVLTINHPGQSNHNGGSIAFGPDGYLYINTGDGGGGGDPSDNAQNLGSLLGKQLRLDVNAGTSYGIPPGNPFVGVPGARPEIWAYGLRNPWRFSFDRLTGDIFIGDVGQNAIEEIDFQPAGQGGLNYGWDDMEGRQCYEPPSGCLTANRVLPILEVNHSAGDCAIVGGFRYRGSEVPYLTGKYLHSDNCTGRIRVATETAPGVWSDSIELDTPYNVTTFGEDGSGELLVGAGSTVYRIVRGPSALPVLLLSDATVSEPASGTRSAVFTVTLSPASGQTVTVGFATVNGTATAPGDYLAAAGTLTFAAGETSKPVSVTVNSDALDEPDETLLLNLATPTNAVIADGQGVGTIHQSRQFHTVTPCRVLDTRGPNGPLGGPALSPGQQRTFVVTGGPCALPASARAVSVNLTVVTPTAAGFLTLFPGGGSLPPTSTINYAPGQVRANNGVFRLAGDGSGRLTIANGSAGTTQVLLDVNGYFE
jgi:hypothetical protein